MRIQLKPEAGPVIGSRELTAVPADAKVPVTAVRLRQEYIRRSIKAIKQRIRSFQMASDFDTAKDVEEELETAERKILLLDKVRTVKDHLAYNAYLEFCRSA